MSTADPFEPAVSMRSALGRLARHLNGERLPMGERAALRRMNPAHPGEAALAVYRALEQGGIDVAPATTEFDSWVLILHCLALVDGRHDATRPIGRALVEAGISEARVRQLLEADRAILFRLMPRMARRFAVAGSSADWTELANLMLASGVDAGRAREAKLRIGRSYTAALRPELNRSKGVSA
jgi:CRISPR type I-E-associated protein CasB/Cse2